jgi:predicted lipid-binding transport protein (Tim44 family)
MLMSQVFDPLNLILAGVAIVILWRLRSVLGQRTGNERPPVSMAKPAPEAGGSNVLEFPQTKTAAEKTIDMEPAKPLWEGYAAEGSAVAVGLQKIALADAAFQPKSFLDGAKLAYEMVVEAFAKSDKPTLKSLLSREVLDGFSKAIDARQQAGEKLTLQFVGFEKTEFATANLIDKRASLTVKFFSQMISSTYDKTGALIDGDPKDIKDVIDLWTFERDVNQRDPNWRVVATETLN